MRSDEKWVKSQDMFSAFRVPWHQQLHMCSDKMDDLTTQSLLNIAQVQRCRVWCFHEEYDSRAGCSLCKYHGSRHGPVAHVVRRLKP